MPALLSLLLLLLAASCSAPAGGAAPQAGEQAPPALVFLVRHAEKVDESADAELSADGRLRAEALADLLAEAGVTHLFGTHYLRTRQTLEPLARRTALAIETVDGGAPEELCQRLAALPAGAVAVVAGHSNTVPDLIQRLGGSIPGLAGAGAQLGHAEYDRLFLVVRATPQGRARALELRFGRPSPR